MGLKLAIALIGASIGYILTTLYSLLMRYPLQQVLIRSLLVFSILFITGWFGVLSLQLLAGGEKEEMKTEKNDSEKQQDRDQKTVGEEEFSPLNPPHLEVEEDEKSQGVE